MAMSFMTQYSYFLEEAASEQHSKHQNQKNILCFYRTDTVEEHSQKHNSLNNTTPEQESLFYASFPSF